MAQQPQTLAYAINDSPVGLLAWNGQLLGEDLDPDFALTNVDAVLADRHGGVSGAALLRERAREAPADRAHDGADRRWPRFGGDFSGIRRFAERDHANIVRWTMFDHGGHFAAHKAPDLYVGDIRAFFADVR